MAHAHPYFGIRRTLMPRRVAVLGSTGSIGTQALEIIQNDPELLLHSILCGSNIQLLAEQVRLYCPEIAASAEPADRSLKGIATGAGALVEAIEGADIVLNAIVGSAGLRASLICAERCIPLALANKESLVVGGHLLRGTVESGKLIPVDSEHSTIFRCLRNAGKTAESILLTASGGSARSIPLDSLHDAGIDRILKHPTWNMGARITVDSATMVNKAFEVVEAGWLFPGMEIDVTLHPQSLVHSFVRMKDGSWMCLMGEPDMRIPIQYALKFPGCQLEKIASDCPADWEALTFGELEEGRYPCFEMVTEACGRGASYPAAVNAADEVAVDAFVRGMIPFGGIAEVIRQVIESHSPSEVEDYGAIMEADREARDRAERTVKKLC
ncbi:MAG: 1-deoxy-D-xylulose-5-phosphate reductoisomerase [Candidatus Aegiribacteria sp.]|nr:1-deoxy-D-xylulose-5-phosphate reductoisomerase [Candidatus Aegiribacteria sp.]MBD3295638.1 1-deoxy-D-xylulose-5-phosphate reductoisomerase [Candidatus Fermentibacteria bacterium]